LVYPCFVKFKIVNESDAPDSPRIFPEAGFADGHVHAASVRREGTLVVVAKLPAMSSRPGGAFWHCHGNVASGALPPGEACLAASAWEHPKALAIASAFADTWDALALRPAGDLPLRGQFRDAPAARAGTVACAGPRGIAG